MKIKVDQTAYHRAMREQRQIKPDYFPVGNRAARRAEKSNSRKEKDIGNAQQNRAGRKPS